MAALPSRPEFKFTPLYGCMSRDPLCYVLQVGECNLMLDCGWDERFSLDLVEPLREWAPKVDAVLLSHCSLEHIGALPYAMGKLGMKAKVYGTLPVQKMGSLLMYDQVLSRTDEGGWELFDLDDVDTAFNNMAALRFLERRPMEGKCKGITISPVCAGHTLGGAVWRIHACGEEIVYAVDYNHRRERLLNGAALEGSLDRPAVLITDAYNYAGTPFDRRARDNKLIGVIMATLRGDGNVLLPVDSAGRVLELLLFLDGYWAERRVVYPLVFLNRQAYNTIEFAKSQLEWMSDDLARKFERSRDHFNPFDMRYLQLMHSTAELEGLPPGPCVVLATSPSLETGFSRELFAKWAAEPRNALIFTENPHPETLAGRVQGHSQKAPLKLSLKLSKTVLLEGEELLAFQEEKERMLQEKREAEAAIEVDNEQQAVSRSCSVVSHTMLRAASIKSQASMSKQKVKALEDGDDVMDVVLVDFRHGAPPEDAAAPMFPDEDPPEAVWDLYGRSLDDHIASLRQQAADASATDVIMAEEEADTEERPTKIVTSEVELEVTCQVHTFDFEGRADGRSLRTILSHVAPRKLLVVHAPQELTERMINTCTAELQIWNSICRAPKALETFDVSPPCPNYKVQLSSSLLPSLEFRDMGSCSFAWLSGQIAAAAEEGMPPVLKEVPGEALMTPGSVFIGDVRLSAVKQALAESGIQAEFNGGVLVCANSITVRRGKEEGSVMLEGGLCEEYFRVRDIVYKQFHIC